MIRDDKLPVPTFCVIFQTNRNMLSFAILFGTKAFSFWPAIFSISFWPNFVSSKNKKDTDTENNNVFVQKHMYTNMIVSVKMWFSI